MQGRDVYSQFFGKAASFRRNLCTPCSNLTRSPRGGCGRGVAFTLRSRYGSWTQPLVIRGSSLPWVDDPGDGLPHGNHSTFSSLDADENAVGGGFHFHH